MYKIAADITAEIAEFHAILAETRSVLMSGHVHSDGDCLGSELALAAALTRLGHEVIIVNPDPVPQRYRFLDGIEKVRCITQYSPQEEYDLFLSLDTSQPERHGDVADLINRCRHTVAVDHHIVTDPFAQLDIRHESVSSTGELVFHLIRALDVDLDRAMAEALYTAIATDTERFLFDNTTPETMAIVGELMAAGVKAHLLNTRLFQAVPLSALKLLGDVLQTLRTDFKDRMVIAELDIHTYRAHPLERDQIDFILKTLVNISGSEFTVFYKQLDDNEVGINLRSKSRFNVEPLAAALGGGGHRKAAGVKRMGDLDQVKNETLPAIHDAFANYTRGQDT